jgi:hypothetical protein
MCRDCINNTSSWNMSCIGCMRRWYSILKDENHKQMLAAAMKEKFKGGRDD